jgi:hypothetical protein
LSRVLGTATLLWLWIMAILDTKHGFKWDARLIANRLSQLPAWILNSALKARVIRLGNAEMLGGLLLI